LAVREVLWSFLNPDWPPAPADQGGREGPAMKTTTRVRLQRKIEKLKSQVLDLATQVEEAVQLALEAVRLRDADLAAKVIDGDLDIDRMEVDLEEECLEILALHQPVANDLRFLIAMLKINTFLERIGDLAVNIAETAIFLASAERIEVAEEYFIMAERVQKMLDKALGSFINMSADSAFAVLADDDEVDMMKHKLHSDFEKHIKEDSAHHAALIQMFLVSRNLERMADQATNIAEEVIYMITGEIVRHGRGERKT